MICYLTILIHCIVVGRSLLAEGRVSSLGLYQDLYPSDSIVDYNVIALHSLSISFLVYASLASQTYNIELQLDSEGRANRTAAVE